MARQGRTKAGGWRPTPKQAAVLSALAECPPETPIVEVCKAAGVRRATLYEWLNPDHKLYDPDFVKAWDDLPLQLVRRSISRVADAMIRKALDGDVAAGKLVLEMGKVYRPRGLEIGGKVTLEQLVAGEDPEDSEEP